MKSITFSIFIPMILLACGFAEVTQYDRDYKPNSELGIKDAVILEKIGVIDHAFTRTLSKTTIRVKMKLFTKKAIEDYGTIQLSYDPQGENIGDIEATVYLPDGNTVKLSKSDIHKKKVSKEWGMKEVELSIALPSLVEGAIVEYSYYFSFKGLENITKWFFQNELFTVSSEVTFFPWPSYRCGLTMNNQIKNPIIQEKQKSGKPYYQVSRHQVPALKKESFSLPLKTINESVSFYYFDTIETYSNYWLERGNAIYKRTLKKQMAACKSSKKIVDQNNLIKATPEETIVNIFNFTVQNYTSFATLSKKQSGEIDEKYIKSLSRASTVSKLLKFKYLYKYQMNYVLSSLIAAAIPEATIEYGYYIPREKGKYNPVVQTFKQFTDELIKVSVGDQSYWLSPILRLLPPNRLPAGVNGVKILIIGPKGTHFQRISRGKPEEAVSLSTKEVFISESNISIKEHTIFNKHQSYRKRALMAYFQENEIRDVFEKGVHNSYGEGANLVSFKVENMDDIYKPLIITKEISFDYEIDDSMSMVFLPLFAVDKYKNNPFNAEKRVQKIYFKYPYEATKNISYHLPEGYKLSTVPEDQSVNTNALIYSMKFKKKENDVLVLKIKTTLEKGQYYSSSANFFKKTINGIMKADSSKMVIEEVE